MEILTTPKSLLALDTEVANRWWWYQDTSTRRLMIFVGQWIETREDWVQMPPFGWILVPNVILHGLTRGYQQAYEGLPLVDRRAGLHMIRRTIADADTLVGHNVRDFDLPTINGELMLLNMEMLPEREVLDTLRDTERTGGQSRSLGNRLSRLKGVEEKPHVNPVVWEAAFNDFDPYALREVWERARADVQGHIDLFNNDREKGYLS